MKYAIIGSGAVGEALARAFARKGIEVAIASTRPPEALAPLAGSIGPTIVPKSLQGALAAEVVILAVPFWAHRDVAASIGSWQGKIVIDATNAFGVTAEELGHRPASVVVSQTLAGARLVKAFNHLPARKFAENPETGGGRRVVFHSSDDAGASERVAALIEQLGFAPVSLGRLEEGSLLVQARGRSWSPLNFQDLFKKDEREIGPDVP